MDNETNSLIESCKSNKIKDVRKKIVVLPSCFVLKGDYFSMQNVKRNDPCYCGSGKKYKKCCETKSNHDSLQAILEREVVGVQSEILRDAFTHSEFSTTVQKSMNEFNPPEKMRDSFYFFVGVWALFASKVLSGKTALEQFCESNIVNLRPKVQEIVGAWVGLTPSVVRVESIDGRNVVAKDIFSKECKNVKIIDELTEVPNQGALLLGYIVPFTDEASIFFTSALSFDDEMAENVEQFLSQKFVFASEGAGCETGVFLQDHFLDLVDLFMSDRDLDAFEIEVAATVEDHVEEEPDMKNIRTALTAVEKVTEPDQAAAVVNLLEEKVQSEDMPESVIEAGSTLWQTYYHKKQPQIKNEKIYAAALHYLLVDKVFPVYRRTQKATAELYQASIGSVSTRSREMACVLEEELKELCVK
jgi:uncharacterized protein YecA (UPF0149 family)